MKQWRVFGLGLVCFVLGALVQSGFAQSRRPTFSPDLFQGKDAKTAAMALLDGALQLADGGSWERIAVGRAWAGSCLSTARHVCRTRRLLALAHRHRDGKKDLRVQRQGAGLDRGTVFPLEVLTRNTCTA